MQMVKVEYDFIILLPLKIESTGCGYSMSQLESAVNDKLRIRRFV